MKVASLVASIVCALVVGWVGASKWNLGFAETAQAMQCRPTSPQHLEADKKVLFWGNSLAFDHGWTLDGYQTVNCARQGLTAERAQEATSKLPKTDFAAIILVFGTVELVQGIEETAPFEAAIFRISQQLMQDHPNATILALGIPTGSNGGWDYPGSTQPERLNAALESLSNVQFVDTTQVLSQIDFGRVSYDGIHLFPASYLAIEREIETVLGSD